MHRIPSPGEYVLFARPGKPEWPAIICTDDMAPASLQRPNGYLSLVLVISANLEFHYAALSEMQEYVPVCEHTDKELQAAHNRILNQMDSARSSLEHWKLETKEQRSHNYQHTPSCPSDNIFKEESKKEELRKAKKLSVLNWNPPNKKGNPLNAVALHNSKRRNWGDADYVDGDLSSSQVLVKIYVGDKEEEFLIPKSEVDKMRYLSDAQIGCITRMDDGTSRIDLPCLKDFNPEDFKFVAQFLSTGQFGHSVITEDTRADVIAECAAAWPIADRMVLEDLLDHIVEKLQKAQPWQPEETWILALMVYETSDTLLKAYTTMKEMLAASLADNFYDMILRHGQGFLGPLQEIPELKRDIYRVLFETAEQQLHENGRGTSSSSLSQN